VQQEELPMNNPYSTFAINGHPLHPLVVPFPIALFVSALITDLTYMLTSDPDWATGSYWLIVGGLVMAAIAAVGGLVDFLGDVRIRHLDDAWWHAGANVLVVLAEGISLYFRHRQGLTAVVPLGISLSLVSVILLLFSGWKGGEMVFKHRVAVKDLR
jgi:uncharacterized membrane protein